MLRFLTAAFLILMATSSVAAAQDGAAQDDTAELDSAEASIRAARRALSFNFDGFDLDYFSGGMGGRFWISPVVVLRTSVNVDLDLATDEDGGGEQESSGYGLGLVLGIERHFDVAPRVSPYFGVEASARRSRYTSESVSRRPSSSPESVIRRIEQERTGLSGALNFVVGAEYFIAPRLSVAGEYAVGMRAQRSGIEQTLQDRFGSGEVVRESDEGTRSSFTLTSRSPTLIVSIYF